MSNARALAFIYLCCMSHVGLLQAPPPPAPLVAHRVPDDDLSSAPTAADAPNAAPGPAPLVHLHPAGKAPEEDEGDVEYAVTGAEDNALRMGMADIYVCICVVIAVDRHDDPCMHDMVCMTVQPHSTPGRILNASTGRCAQRGTLGGPRRGTCVSFFFAWMRTLDERLVMHVLAVLVIIHRL